MPSYPSKSTYRHFFFGVFVAYFDSIKTGWGIATGHWTAINGFGVGAAAHKPLIHLWSQVKPGSNMRIDSLAQRRALRYNCKAQRALEKNVILKVFARITIAFTNADLVQVDYEEFGVRNLRAHGKLRIDQGVDIETIAVFAEKSQPWVGTDVDAFFDNRVDHVLAHLLGGQRIMVNSLISKGKSTFFDFRVRDWGIS